MDRHKVKVAVIRESKRTPRTQTPCIPTYITVREYPLNAKEEVCRRSSMDFILKTMLADSARLKRWPFEELQPSSWEMHIVAHYQHVHSSNKLLFQSRSTKHRPPDHLLITSDTLVHHQCPSLVVSLKIYPHKRKE